MKIYAKTTRFPVTASYGYRYDFVSNGKHQSVLFDKGYVSKDDLLAQYPDATDIEGEQCPLDVRGLRSWMKNVCYSTNEYNKALKICDGLDDGSINANNYWDAIRKFTKSVRSDRSINEWERIADYIFNIITLW